VRVGVGLSLEAGSLAAVSEAVGRAVVAAGVGKPDAALVWLTHHHAEELDAMIRQLRDKLGIERIVGGVVPGVIVGDREVFDAPAVAVMSFHDQDPWRFTTMLILDLSERNQQAAQALGAAGREGDLVVAMLSTASFQPTVFEQAMQRAPARGAITGGGAVNIEGPDWVFTEWGSHGDALAALVIRDCDPCSGLAHSCRPISRALPVTAANGRMLSSLSGHPAAKVLKSVVERAKLSKEDLGRRVLVAKAPGPSASALARGEFVVRPLVGIEQRVGALYLGGDVGPGDALCFVLRDLRHARMELNAMALELRTRSRAPGPPSFSLVVDCSGRSASFQGIPEHDAPVLAALLPPAPMAGFFSGFELAPEPTGPSCVHLFSCVVTLGW
jgi:small ligand-binding sensory domain FIST